MVAPLLLADRLRAETRTLHAQVERSTFMAALLGGRLTRRQYCLLLRNLEPLYTALEDGFSHHASHPGIAPLYFPALFRSATLRRDLSVLQGGHWADELELLPAAVAYVRHMQALAQHAPGRLAAHAYVRYLGDLSGGQILKALVARSLQLPLASTTAGTDFYEFGPPAEVARLTQAFRAGLGALPGNEGDDTALVREVTRAYEMHGHLFRDLAQACGLPPPGLRAY